MVGTRVVVRRLVRGETGPTGGPAFTDLLGTCTEWDAAAGHCTIRPDGARGGGEPVRVPLADIVSGKPVPPRPSVRHRVTPRAAQGHAGVMFPGTEQEPLGAWLLRSDPAPVGRLHKRANSALAMGDPGLGFEEAERLVREWYAARGRDPLVQVEAGSAEEAAYVAAGWAPLDHGETELRLASLSAVRRARRGRSGGRSGPARAVLASGDGTRAHAVVPGEGDPLAEGRAALDGDWLGLHALRTRLDRRRQGLAGEVVDALLEWGAERGALTVWLHVETGNTPARAFYDALGLPVHHVARYLAPR